METEQATIERLMRKQHGDLIHYMEHDFWKTAEVKVLRNGVPGVCHVETGLKEDLLPKDRFVLSDGIWDVSEIGETSITCVKNNFETSWRQLKDLGCEVGLGVAEAVSLDPDTERYLDGWVGVYTKNILAHYDKIKSGRNIRAFHGMFTHDIPVACVGAGPSLDKNIDLLKDFPGLIICADRAYKSLRARGINPDWVLSIDCHYDLVANMMDCPGTERHRLILNVCSDPKIAEIWKGKIFWYLMRHPGVQFMDRVLPAMFPDFGGLENAGNVGNASMLLAEYLGLAPIVLVGQDFSYTGGKMHADRYEIKADGTADLLETDHAKLLEDRAGKIEIDGVTTYSAFRLYKFTAEHLYEIRGFNIVNCTEGGILNKIPCRPLTDVIKDLKINFGAKYVEARNRVNAV